MEDWAKVPGSQGWRCVRGGASLRRSCADCTDACFVQTDVFCFQDVYVTWNMMGLVLFNNLFYFDKDSTYIRHRFDIFDKDRTNMRRKFDIFDECSTYTMKEIRHSQRRFDRGEERF